MRFQLNGETFEIDPVIARSRILNCHPEPIKTHWVEIEGGRWPAKQAFEAATGIRRSEYISHTAVRLLARLGFDTSEIPNSVATPSSHAPRPGPRRPPTTPDEAAHAFSTLDAFLQRQPLTNRVSDLESALSGADLEKATDVVHETELAHEVLDAALIVRERVGVLDSLIHAAVITQMIPMLLEEDERLVKRPSLAAGNDPDRIFDLETNLRVAEFKVAQWKGADSLRQRGLVADLVGLAMDLTGRRRQLFVVGDRPKHFLQTSRRSVVGLLSKSALRLRTESTLGLEVTVAQFTQESGVEVVDLAQWFPRLSP